MPPTPVRFLPALLLLLLLAPSGARAQSAGALRGRVTDPAGAPLAGVTVTVSSSSQGVSGRGAVTDASGAFQIAALPPGSDYSVHLSLQGYSGVVLNDTPVNAGQITPLTVVLPLGRTMEERVQVRATPPVVTLEETSSTTRFSSEFVDALPILGRNYQDVLTLAPGVTDVDGDGNPNIHGARDTDVGTIVDGVSTSDPYTGKVGAQLNIESIEEIEVKTSGASAEFGRAQGGFANILTKSGGNDFEGAFKFFWRGSRLDGDGAGIDNPALHGGVGEQGLRDLTFNDFLPFLSAGGPIVRDKAFFYVSLEYISKEDPVNALNAAFVTGVREVRAFGKATWQVSPSQRLALSVNYDPQEFLNQGLNSFTREETSYTQKAGGTNVTLKAVSVLSPTVVLETNLAHLDSRPERIPNLSSDTNGNGSLYFDRDADGFLSPKERDAGEDFDKDGAFDVFEDTHIPNHKIDLWECHDPNDFRITRECTEDADHDGRLTPAQACEGAGREDRDCDGHLDNVNEDQNHNGILDTDEDLDSDHRLDLGTEDRNSSGHLEDTPFPTDTYPYGTLRPVAPDRDYLIDQSNGVISGPYYQQFDDRRQRVSLRADLSVFVADFKGSHDLRGGMLMERESFNRETFTHDITSYQPAEPATCDEEAGSCLGGRSESMITLLPVSYDIQSEASGMSGAVYVQDVYKPRSNLSLGLGLRFERELARAPGYTTFDPRAERQLYDRLSALSGGEIGLPDSSGNGDGITSKGILGDPFFSDEASRAIMRTMLIDPLHTEASRRMTRNRSGLGFTINGIANLFPDVLDNGMVDPQRLSELGLTVQQPTSFDITNNNLSPRLSVAWDPGSDSRTKVFATWGRYYDKLFLSTISGEQDPDTLSRYYQVDHDGLDTVFQDGQFVPITNHGLGRLMSKAPPSIHQIDRNLATPYSDEFTFGFERELAPEVALTVRYIGRDFRDQLQDVDLNHDVRINPETGELVDTFGTLLLLTRPRTGSIQQFRVPDGKPDLFINNVFFNQVLRVGNYNQARYRAIEIELLRRLSRRWEMQTSYVYSRAQGDAEDFQSRVGNDPSVLENASGYLDFDQRHVVKLNGSVFLPGDWQIGAAASWASGLPYSVVSRFFATDNADYSQFRTRYGYTVLEGNQLKFVPLPRNSERNAAVLDINLRARKNFVIGRTTAAVSLEVFDLLNTDDLRIYTYEPNRGEGFDLAQKKTVSGPIQIDATRQFGRRFQIGFQIAF